MIEQLINEILENIQEVQVNAGGRFLKQSEIKKMTVEELLLLLIPNGVLLRLENQYKSVDVESEEKSSDVTINNVSKSVGLIGVELTHFLIEHKLFEDYWSRQPEYREVIHDFFMCKK